MILNSTIIHKCEIVSFTSCRQSTASRHDKSTRGLPSKRDAELATQSHRLAGHKFHPINNKYHHSLHMYMYNKDTMPLGGGISITYDSFSRRQLFVSSSIQFMPFYLTAPIHAYVTPIGATCQLAHRVVAVPGIPFDDRYLSQQDPHI